MSPDPLASALRQLADGQSLTAGESAAAFDVLMEGKAAPSQIAALLMALRVKGETSEEVAGAVRALRRVMITLEAGDPDSLVDTCGTGGGASTTFNISTAAALVAAGAGVRIAKHGNRSFTSRSGSADVLEALGIAIDVPPEVMATALRDAGIVFMFAPLMHPAMRHVGPVRRELAIPTIMNILGPLANPAGVRRQIVGVANKSRLELIAGALASLGAVHSLVVHGEPGMDEISPIGRTYVFEVRNGDVKEWEINPEVFGIVEARAEELEGGTPAENAATIEKVLSGKGAPTAEAAVLLNAAAAIYVSGQAASMQDGYAAARKAIADGRAMGALEKLRRAQKGQ